MPRLSAAANVRESLLLVACSMGAMLAAGCGSSSQTITAPPPSRCAVQAQLESSSFPLAGGSGSLTISTNRECGWSVRSDASWLVPAGPTDGQGDGVVKFSVAANADPASRTAAFTVNDRRLEIRQAGKPCDFRLSSTREAIEASGGDRTIQVTASSAQCTWTAAADQPWIVVKAGSEGRGDGAVTFHVAPMAGPPRAGTLIVAGGRVSVEQGAGCAFAIGAFDTNLPSSGGALNVSISTTAGCGWTASSQSVWITIRSGDAGAGSGQVQFIVGANGGPAREGVLTIAGRLFVVTQASGCTYSITPGVQDAAGAGGTGAISISTGPACPWTASSGAEWLTLSAVSGTGPSQVSYTATPNTGTTRAGTLTVAGHAATINQPSMCSFVLAPPYLTYDEAGGNGAVLVIVSGPCTWTASSGVDWVRMVSGTSGTGDGLVQFTVAPNAGQPRGTNLQIAGQSFAVTQGGK
jgi:hypothetical protein